MTVKAIPDNYHTVTPYLIVKGADELIDFMKLVFDGKETERVAMPDGSIMHAEVKIGDSAVMMGEAGGKWEPRPGSLYLYVTDTDAIYQKALKAGAISVMEPANMFYGDRNAGVKDLCGNFWWIATHVEDVAPEELKRRAQEFMKNKSGQ